MKPIDHPAIIEQGRLDHNGMPTGWHIDCAKISGGVFRVDRDGRLFIAGIEVPEMLAERQRMLAGHMEE